MLQLIWIIIIAEMVSFSLVYLSTYHVFKFLSKLFDLFIRTTVELEWISVSSFALYLYK